MPLDDATLWDLCRDKEFRHRLAFLALGCGLARQIRAMRKQRKWTQRELARRAGLSQPQVAILGQWCGNASIRSLKKIAVAFDVALIVRFVSWGEFFLSLGKTDVPMSFDEEMAALNAGGGNV